MKRIVLSLAILALAVGAAWAAEVPVTPEPLFTPAVQPALVLDPLSGAQPASESSLCLGQAGLTCTLVISCSTNLACVNQIGSGPVRTESCRCCDNSFPPHCTSTVQSVSCGC